MWTFTGPKSPGAANFMIAGYYWMAWRPGVGPGSPALLTNMAFRNPLDDIWIRKVTDKSARSGPSDLVLMSDIVLSNQDSRSTANNNFVSVYGGYFAGHGTTHRAGMKPLGGNNLYLDGHVEWRNFDSMKNRMFSNPQFWF
jgi:prepilin-type processing-associated H-X9-DG protein